MNRKLVTLRKVSELNPIPNADKIELATVDGWECVVGKGEFNVNDWGVYFEIDSMIPYAEWSKFLFKNEKEIERGFLRIKTQKFRGALSQGLFLPLDILLDVDLSDVMGVHKYEPPIPESMSAKGRFPSFITKTDEERIQNLIEYLNDWSKNKVYITEKLDGSSITLYCCKNTENETTVWKYGVASRNLELKLKTTNEEGVLVPTENKFVSTARKMKIEEKMRAWCNKHDKNLVLQGELIGEGIQGNIYKLKGRTIKFFTVQDGKNKALPYKEFIEVINELGLDTVPILETDVLIPNDYKKLLKMAEDKSQLRDTQREGIVIRAMDGSFSFKVISNKYLLKHGK